MRTHPRVLRVEGGSLSLWDTADGTTRRLPDLPASSNRWLRKLEAALRLDLSSALQVKRAAEQYDYDILWAGSEKIGIPLSFIRLQKPLVVIAHHMSSPLKARLARITRAVDRWAGVGFISDEGRDFFINYFRVPPNRLFLYESAKFLEKYNARDITCDGPIMSVGVAKRDYGTLLAALAELPECEAELYISSRFGDTLQRQAKTPLPKSVKLMTWITDEELLRRYHRTRFAVVPLLETSHTGAGISAVLEASALGKAVIATRTGGMATFVKDGVTGILVPPNDVNAWRDAIKTLWTDPQLAHRLGEAGRRYMVERYHPRVIHAQLQAFLDSLYAQQHR